MKAGLQLNGRLWTWEMWTIRFKISLKMAVCARVAFFLYEK
jgi:hypothetical protein